MDPPRAGAALDPARDVVCGPGTTHARIQAKIEAIPTVRDLVCGPRERRSIVEGSRIASLSLHQPADQQTSGQNPTVAKDETIKGDIFLSGERVQVEGTVDGDVFAAGKDIDIDGHVTGDVITAGRYLRIPGIVDGNVRSAGNTVVVVEHEGQRRAFRISDVQRWGELEPGDTVLDPAQLLG